MESPHDPFGDMERLFSRGIHITSITPPEQGWPIAMYCPICKETVFMLSTWAVKPEDGDYWRMNDFCADEVNGFKHNLQIGMVGMKGYKFPVDINKGKLNFMVLDPTPKPMLPSVFSFTHEMDIEEAKRRYPDTPIPDKE